MGERGGVVFKRREGGGVGQPWSGKGQEGSRRPVSNAWGSRQAGVQFRRDKMRMGRRSHDVAPWFRLRGKAGVGDPGQWEVTVPVTWLRREPCRISLEHLEMGFDWRIFSS